MWARSVVTRSYLHRPVKTSTRQTLNLERDQLWPMPKYIDTHPMGSLTSEQLKQLQKAPKDKFGITHHDILYNKKENPGLLRSGCAKQGSGRQSSQTCR